MTVSVVDFFSGCGGTSLGLRQAGLEVRLGIDQDPQAAASYRRNFPEAGFLETDISCLDVDAVRELMPTGPTLFAGCAPCQPFSGHNRQKSQADKRIPLLSEFKRFVSALLPDFVVVENVPGLQRIGMDGPFPGFQNQLSRLGYQIATGVLRSGDYGVPQERRRLVLVASLHGLPTLPAPKPNDQPTVRGSIYGLPHLEAGGKDACDPDHQAMRLSPLNLERIKFTPEGGSHRHWPRQLLADCHVRHKGHSDAYGRMAWDRPASGLTTRCLSYSNGRFGHPEQDRAISAREAALIQTFPPDFRFEGSLLSKGVQIGNAVPPAMARHIGEAILMSFSGRPVRGRRAETGEPEASG